MSEYQDMTDLELAQRASSENADWHACETLILRHDKEIWKSVRYHGKKYCPADQDRPAFIEDLYGEVIVRMIDKLENYTEGPFLGWAKKTIRNLAIDMFRKEVGREEKRSAEEVGSEKEKSANADPSAPADHDAPKPRKKYRARRYVPLEKIPPDRIAAATPDSEETTIMDRFDELLERYVAQGGPAAERSRDMLYLKHYDKLTYEDIVDTKGLIKEEARDIVKHDEAELKQLEAKEKILDGGADEAETHRDR